MLKRGILLPLLLLAATPGFAADVVRHKIPNSTFPISAAVEVPAGKTLVFLSGAVPPVADTAAAKDTPQAYGDTRTQTVGVLTSIEKQLKGMGLSLGDVVKMQVFLVGDPAKGGKMDFAGFMAGYTQFFGTPAQPNLPSRSAMQVAGLASPNFLVEIEVTAVRP
ncbi:enamine deaminase RidA (YjgF/YER057c/UK114 family) [Luteibacter sp. OK325]|uniref:RidA family protein n=1 Tax=Luteibacter sp. OK325 TaxID=2135670 RepID=UPI000D3AF575|nr:RidA family protein [Luteibacter sp. OK325]PTR28603.1 enamine deaminase RidA (YjgF/YER057c/UK114 family) [Luteibacter sp. OK325]